VNINCETELIPALVNLKDCPGLVLRNSMNFSGRISQNYPERIGLPILMGRALSRKDRPPHPYGKGLIKENFGLAYEPGTVNNKCPSRRHPKNLYDIFGIRFGVKFADASL